MAGELRIMIEVGPRGKRVVAFAPDWPGLSRGAKTEELAVEKLRDYLDRYKRVAQLAGLESAFDPAAGFDVIERYAGTPSTDFWGISFAFSSFDKVVMSTSQLDREMTLMQASWAFFDEVRTRVSFELMAGPRGGEKNRDQVVRHTIAAEQHWAKKLGIRSAEDGRLSEEELREYRDAYCDAIRTLHAGEKMARTWPLRYLIRHTAFHTLDHSWEMEDKDMTGVGD